MINIYIIIIFFFRTGASYKTLPPGPQNVGIRACCSSIEIIRIIESLTNDVICERIRAAEYMYTRTNG